MTLRPYEPEKLDQLCLRFLDLAAASREMANLCRENEIDELALHDKKAKEMCEKLEDWVRKARADLELRISQARARRRAMSTRP